MVYGDYIDTGAYFKMDKMQEHYIGRWNRQKAQCSNHRIVNNNSAGNTQLLLFIESNDHVLRDTWKGKPTRSPYLAQVNIWHIRAIPLERTCLISVMRRMARLSSHSVWSDFQGMFWGKKSSSIQKTQGVCHLHLYLYRGMDLFNKWSESFKGI